MGSQAVLGRGTWVGEVSNADAGHEENVGSSGHPHDVGGTPHDPRRSFLVKQAGAEDCARSWCSLDTGNTTQRLDRTDIEDVEEGYGRRMVLDVDIVDLGSPSVHSRIIPKGNRRHG